MLRGRDRAMIGAVILANVIVVIGVVLLARSDDGGNGRKDATEPSRKLPRAGRTVENRTIGASIRKPRGWAHERAGNSLILRSPDSTTILSVSLPPGATSSAGVLRTAQAAIRREYRRVKVTPQSGRVANLPAVSVAVSAVNRRGTPVNIFVSAAQGRKRAWLVQVFSAPGARSKRLAEAQGAIGTLRLSG